MPAFERSNCCDVARATCSYVQMLDPAGALLLFIVTCSPEMHGRISCSIAPSLSDLISTLFSFLLEFGVEEIASAGGRNVVPWASRQRHDFGSDCKQRLISEQAEHVSTYHTRRSTPLSCPALFRESAKMPISQIQEYCRIEPRVVIISTLETNQVTC